MIDLHMHTKFSDGTDDCVEILERVQSIGLDISVSKKSGEEVDLMSDTDDLRKAAPKRILSDIDSELLNINFLETPSSFKE